MSPAPPSPPPTPPSRPLPQPGSPDELRPTDIVGATFLPALGFLAAAALAAAAQAFASWPWTGWLALHLAFVGGVSQLVLGASQFFAGAFLATDPPPRRLVRLQLLAWNCGTLLLLYAVPSQSRLGIPLGAALLLLGLAAWGAGVRAMWRKSLRRSPWATRWYVAGAAFLGLGALAGTLLGLGERWAWGSLLTAHIALNVGGWFGGAIVGTLHTFYPSLTATQLRFPRLQGVTFAAWTAAIAALAAGYAFALDALAVGGWLLLLAAAVTLSLNLIASRLSSEAPLSLAARVVGAGQPFLVAGALVAAVAALADGPNRMLSGDLRETVAILLLAGWLGLTVLGSLIHLLAVLVRVRSLFSAKMPTARPRLDIALTLLAAGAVAAGALSEATDASGPGRIAAVAATCAFALLAGRVAALAWQVLTKARPRI